MFRMRRGYSQIHKSLIKYFVWFFLFTFCIVSFSSFESNKYWCESEVISKYIEKTGETYVVMCSRSDNYPDFSNNARNYLGYEIIKAYANNQESFVCAYKDEDIDPFHISLIDDGISSPFICMNGYGGNKESTVERFAETMFQNIIKSADLGVDKIYITQHTANMILNNEDPSESEYKSLIGTKIWSRYSKKGVLQEKQFEILDILVSYKHKWLETYYGNDFVIGGFYVANQSMFDNLSVHTIMENDVFSNAYFLSKVKPLLIDNCKYQCKYYSFSDMKIEANQSLNNLIYERNNKPFLVRYFLPALLVCLFVAFIILLFVNRRLKNDLTIFNKKTSLLIISITFSASILFLYLLKKILSNYYISLLSPFGFAFGAILYVLILLYILFLQHNKRIISDSYFVIDV